MRKNNKDGISVHLIAPAKEQSGIGDYTDDLFDGMRGVNIERNVLPADSNNPLKFTECAIKGGLTDADLVHIQHEYGLFGPGSILSFVFFPIIYLLSITRNLPVVITIHEALNKDLVTSPLYRFKQFYIKFVNICITLHPSYVIFLSKNSYQKFSNSVSLEKYEILPHGVNPERRIECSQGEAKQKLGYEPTDTIISEPGYVEPRKGNEILIEIAKQLPEYEFLIAGGPANEEYTDYFEEIQQRSPSNLKITGHLPEHLFHATFMASDIIILPYRRVDQRGIINSLNQSGIFNRAATYSKPVITSDLKHFENVEAEWNCPLTRDFDEVDIVIETIQNLLSNKSECEELSREITKYAKANSFVKIAQQHLDIYYQVVT
jgi:glycosyltransferase involved in cell wall biosynthesis